MSKSISEFFAECETRGPLSLRDHLNSSIFADKVEERAMRVRAIGALKLPKWKHLLGRVILNDGTRSFVFSGQPVTSQTVPAPSRPASLIANQIDQIQSKTTFNFPTTNQHLQQLESTTAKLPAATQRIITKAVSAMNDERIVESTENRHLREIAKRDAEISAMKDEMIAMKDKVIAMYERADGKNESLPISQSLGHSKPAVSH